MEVFIHKVSILDAKSCVATIDNFLLNKSK